MKSIVETDTLKKNTIAIKSEDISKRNKYIAMFFGIGVALCVVIGVLSILIKPTINLNDYITLSVSGYNTVGTAEVTFEYAKFTEDYHSKLELAKSKISSSDTDSYYLDAYYDDTPESLKFIYEYVKWTVDKTENLSNDDVITLSWECLDEKILNIYGYKIKYEPIEYTVSGLEELETFDPFAWLEVGFDGISGDGHASMFVVPGVEGGVGQYYSFDKNYDLSNGDIITVSIDSYGKENVIDFCIKEYGMIPYPLEKTYVVNGLSSYVNTISQISETSLNTLQNQANDAYSAHIVQNWGTGEELTDFTYVGSYLLTPKSYDTFGIYNNSLYLVYKASIHNSYSNRGSSYDATNEIYWFISYRNVLVDPDGNITTDITNYKTPTARVYIDSGIRGEYYSNKQWKYYGYDSYDSLYKAIVTSNIEYYNCEETLVN